MHLSTNFGENIFIQFGDVDIFRNSTWRPSWIFTISEFGTFRRDDRLSVS